MTRPTNRVWTLLLTIVLTVVISVPLTVWASHQFTDVPDSHTFHNAIDWMADNGSTVGCNPPANDRYCPENNVSRGQMAAFMKRLAESGVVNAATAEHAESAGDAATLEGKAVDDLVPRAAFNSTNNAPGGQSLTLPTEIIAPAPGILIMSGTVDAFSPSTATNPYVCILRVNGAFVPGTRMVAQVGGAGLNTEENCATTGAAVVPAGTHAIDFQALGIITTTSLSEASVWVLWVPFDGTGAVPTALTQLGGAGEINAPRLGD